MTGDIQQKAWTVNRLDWWVRGVFSNARRRWCLLHLGICHQISMTHTTSFVFFVIQQARRVFPADSYRWQAWVIRSAHCLLFADVDVDLEGIFCCWSQHNAQWHRDADTLQKCLYLAKLKRLAMTCVCFTTTSPPCFPLTSSSQKRERQEGRGWGFSICWAKSDFKPQNDFVL